MSDGSERPLRVLLADDEVGQPTAAGRALAQLVTELRAQDVEVVASASREDACAIVASDAAIQCAIVDWDLGRNDHAEAEEILSRIRDRNLHLPVFLLADRSSLSTLPTVVMQQTDDFIWLLEDTAEFITGRIVAAAKRYQTEILPPMFGALMTFSDVHEYSWHTPGHTGGTAFLKSPVGRAFHSYFGEHMLRSDLSISVGELGSLLDHSGPIGAGERNAARVFGADRTYYVTNGTSTSNRVVVMASVTRGDIALCDRNCHKSIEHAMTMAGAVPTYLVPSRNHLGIIGPVRPDRLSAEGIAGAIAANPLVDHGTTSAPRLSILTNSTYDGLCYNIARVEELLGQSVDRMLFDEAWYGYARFNPLYAHRFAMHEKTSAEQAGGPTVFATQSTHKLLAALSQASMIHVRDGKRPIPHNRFNEAFMMHASTSPQYAIIASNDVSAAMMDGPGGTALTTESIREAVGFRQMIARIRDEFAERGDWFFDLWQPAMVPDGAGGRVAFHAADPEHLVAESACWELAPGADWHGFGDLEAGYCMLDPIKVTVVTPGATAQKGPAAPAIPAPVLSAYLDDRGIVPEKTGSHTVLFLFSLGITRGKWGTLVNALLEFKRDYDANLPLSRALPALVAAHPDRYAEMGLRDLCAQMHGTMDELAMAECLEKAFSTLPEPACTPVEAYEHLVRDEIEQVALSDLADRVVATGIVPYPPGIPLLMPGERTGGAGGPALAYLATLEAFDGRFPGFEHDTHGIEVIEGRYHALCLRTDTAAASARKEGEPL
ncbi:Orn/Lys/Arg family decarboxylase [Acidimangrovimonas sediminis]|uniref:Orn/Lys/Arg family decarboxylase n=1 Tax=Acidimangrovimonas sediminis TaxID=2056283 RepID=UPI0018EB4C57|nr:Orn/Lys/Arg decarboxylase N-terminal domain-containing protein [Acidimangrovimonas sediminis]